MQRFFVIRMTQIIVFIGMMNILINVLLNFLLVNRFESVGLALATSLSAIFSVVIYFLVLKRYVPEIQYKVPFTILIKSFCAASVMGYTVWGINQIFFANMVSTKLEILLEIVVLTGFGGIVYFILSILFKNSVVCQFYGMVKEKIVK